MKIYQITESSNGEESLMIARISVLDKGFVKLINFSSDLEKSVLHAAGVCIGRDEAPLSRLQYLLSMQPPHTTPWEHNILSFDVKAPIFVIRQWQRQRVGVSYNETSLRYTESELEYYVPKEQNTRSYVAAMTVEIQRYKELLHNGWPKERARAVLGTGFYTFFTVSFNLLSLFHFIKLRAHPAAQWEIQQYAHALFEMLLEISEPIWSAFIGGLKTSWSQKAFETVIEERYSHMLGK